MLKSKYSSSMKFSDQIRGAIRASGLSGYRIAKEAGVPESSLSRFMSGATGLSTGTLDKIADVLRLEVVVRGPRKSLVRKYGGR